MKQPSLGRVRRLTPKCLYKISPKQYSKILDMAVRVCQGQPLELKCLHILSVSGEAKRFITLTPGGSAASPNWEFLAGFLWVEPRERRFSSPSAMRRVLGTFEKKVIVGAFVLSHSVENPFFSFNHFVDWVLQKPFNNFAN